MELTFLGTGAMMPTKERNTSAVYLEFNGEGFLFDCGEGTQRQMKIAGIALPRIRRIFLTHWHGDHVLGLPGVIQSLGASDYARTLFVYGPDGSRKHFESMMRGTLFDHSVPTEYFEADTGKITDAEGYFVECAKMEHGVPCTGFSFSEKDRRKIMVDYVRKLGIPDGPILGRLQEGKNILWKGKTVSAAEATTTVKGKKITYIMDTATCKNALSLAKESDILICESSFSGELQEKAEEYSHMTATDAATLAFKAKAKKLVITHFSPRYRDVRLLEEEARKIFPNTFTAQELMKVKV